MRANIRKVARFFVAGFVVIILILTNLTVIKRERLMASPYNKHRLSGWDTQSHRGGIYDYRGEVLAVTDNKSRRRHYPRGKTMAPVLGYLDPNIGAAGLEARYSAELGGWPSFWAALGFGLPLTPVGEDLILTVNANLQQLAMDCLAGYHGAAVVLDPRTGAVLALASQPSFDPEHIAQEWGNVYQDAASPLLNRAVQGLYPPGSILKLLTMASALSQKPDLATRLYNCSGTAYGIRCSEPHGELDLVTALAVSCNTVFAELGVELGNGILAQQAKRIWFNRSIPFELPLAVSLFSSGQADDNETAQRAIGQGQIVVTPMQMALLTAAIAGEGVIWQPYLVQERHLAGRVFVQTKPRKLASFISPAVATALTEAMIEVSERGTGTGMFLPGVKVAGKTGTAENPHGAPHAWYVGFAPADNPRVVVTVLVENAGSGAAAALPLARQLLGLALEEVS